MRDILNDIMNYLSPISKIIPFTQFETTQEKHIFSSGKSKKVTKVTWVGGGGGGRNLDNSQK